MRLGSRRLTRFSRVVAGLCLFLLFAVTASADHTSRTLWVSADQSVLEVSPVDGVPALELGDLPDVKALAVDQRTDHIWIYNRHQLQAYDAQGNQLVDTTLPYRFDDDQTVALAVDGKAGNVWLAQGHRLYRFDLTGQLKAQQFMRRAPTAVTVDPTRSQLWIAEDDGLVVLDQTGTTVATASLRGIRQEPETISYDASLDEVWVAFDGGIARYDHSGNQVFSAPLKDDLDDFMAPDGQGNIWLADGSTLVHVNQSGTVDFALQPFSDLNHGEDYHRHTILGLVADPLNHSVWVASRRYLQQYGSDSTLLQTVDSQTWSGNSTPGRGGRGDEDGRWNWNDWSWFGRGYQGVHDLALYVDTIPPTVSITSPSDGTYTNHNRPEITLSYADIGSGVDVTQTKIKTVDGVAVPATCTATSANDGATCTPNTALSDGHYTLSVAVTDYAGNVSKPATVSLTIDTVPPTITITNPAKSDVDQAQITLTGAMSEAGILTIDGSSVPLSTSFQFSDAVTFKPGNNTVTLVGTDLAGNVTTVTKVYDYELVPPAPDGTLIAIADPINGSALVTGKAGAVEAGDIVVITNTRTSQYVTVTANADGSFSTSIAAGWGDPITVVAKNPADTDEQSSATQTQAGTLPPAPASVATSLVANGVTPFAQATAFLYSGANPIQIGVQANTIEGYRAAVIRGTVDDANGNPLSGVVVAVLNHPEYGYTVSRADGMFDLAVNGGGYLTVTYTKHGYLPAQRQVKAPWRNYVFADPVDLVQPDTNSNPVTFGAGAPAQIAQGSVETDSSGTRQATLFFPAGTSAIFTAPDGSSKELTAGNVRLTEFTVGPNGPERMPAELPPTSDYTYALDMSLDQQLSAGGGTVTFNQTAYLYVTDFLKFPAGTVVPDGYYNPQSGQWVADKNGVVVTILGVDATGLAEVDVDGKGVAATATELAKYGFSDAELAQLAKTYQVGTSLLRVPVTHFCFRDTNWAGCKPANLPKTNPTPPPNKPTTCPGCEISAETQSVGETIPLTGTPYSLKYSSARSTNGYSIDIPLTTASPPTDLGAVVLKVDVAGQEFEKTFTPTPNLTYHYVWNGLDGYGRPVAGHVEAQITLGYTFSDFLYEGLPFFGAYGDGTYVTGELWRMGATVWRTYEMTFGKAPGTLAVGWSLNAARVYDPTNHTMYLGDGTSSSATSLPYTRTEINDGGQILGVAPDGTLYVQASYSGGNTGNTEYQLHLVPTIGNNTSYVRYFLPGKLDSNIAMGPDGTLYVAHAGSVYTISLNSQFKLVTFDKIVAGNGTAGETGDGGPATAAELNNPSLLAIGPDGSLYIGDTGSGSIRRVTTDGTITTLGTTGEFPNLNALVVDRYGNVYIGQSSDSVSHGLGDIKRIDPSGTVTHIAYLYLTYMSLGYDGDLYVYGIAPNSPAFGERPSYVYRVSPNGAITTLLSSDAALNVSLVSGLIVDQNGDLILNGIGSELETPRDGLWRFAPSFPPAGLLQYAIPSSDGSRIYHFDASGQELQVTDALTGNTVTKFNYDSDGDLSSITDSFGNTTQIEWSAAGKPSAIVAPFGQTTKLTTNSEGEITDVTTPGGSHYGMTYDAGGLITQFADPNGGVDNYSYDADGRLSRNQNAIGGGWSLSHENPLVGSQVTMTTALGRKYIFSVGESSSDLSNQLLSSDDSEVFPDDTRFSRGWDATNGSERTTNRDGSYQLENTFADYRFGSAVPLPDPVATCSDGQHCEYASDIHRTTLVDPGNPYGAVKEFTDTLTINDARQYIRTFDPATLMWTETDPMGLTDTVQTSAAGEPLTVQMPGVAPINYSYDSTGRITQVRWGAADSARTTTYSYYPDGSQAGYLKSVTNALGQSVGYQYDNDGRVVTETLPDGQAINFGYDANGNLTSLTPPGRPAHTFSYTGLNALSGYTPPDSGVANSATQYAYNADNQLTEVTHPDGSMVDLAYNPVGQLSTLSAGSDSRQFTYLYSHVTGITTSDNENLSFDWRGAELVSESWLGPVSGSIAWTYDSEPPPAGSKWTTMTNGNVVGLTLTDSLGSYSLPFKYDADNRLTQADDLTITRDTNTGMISGTTLNGVTSARIYDSFGELNTETFNTVPSTVIKFAVSNTAVNVSTLLIKGTVGASGTLTITDTNPYDSSTLTQEFTVVSGQPIDASFTLNSGTNNLVFQLNDTNGRVLATDQATVTVSPVPPPATYEVSRLQAVDAAGTVYFDGSEVGGSSFNNYVLQAGSGTPQVLPYISTSSEVAVGGDNTVYYLDHNSILWHYSDGTTTQVADLSSLGQVDSFTVSPEGRIYVASAPSVYQVGANGILTHVADLTTCNAPPPSAPMVGATPLPPSSPIYLQSSAYGLTGACPGMNRDLSISLINSQNGSVTQLVADTGSQSFQYALSPSGELCWRTASGYGAACQRADGTTETLAANYWLQDLQYNATGQFYFSGTPSSATGVIGSNIYVLNGQTATALIQPPPSSPPVQGTLALSEAQQGADGTVYSVTYTRDDLGRISQKTETENDITTTWGYGYDTEGRLASVTDNGTTIASYGYDANGNRTTVNGQTVATYDDQDRLLTYGQNRYTYTAQGQLDTKTTSAGATQYGYDGFGNLRDVTLPDGTAIHYIVDGRNRRVGKEVNGKLQERFLYLDQIRPIAELSPNGMVSELFIYGTRANVPDYIIKDGNRYRVIADQLGSPRLIVDALSGVIVEQIDYDVWGNVINDTNPGFQPFGFAGGLYDQDTKLVHFGARDYDPETGRWTTKDPMLFAGGETSLYGYAGNDPINNLDPLGLICLSHAAIEAFSGSVSGAIAGAASMAEFGLPGIIAGAVVGGIFGAASGYFGSDSSNGATLFGGLGGAATGLTNPVTGALGGAIGGGVTYGLQKNGSPAVVAAVTGGAVGGAVGAGAEKFLSNSAPNLMGDALSATAKAGLKGGIIGVAAAAAGAATEAGLNAVNDCGCGE